MTDLPQVQEEMVVVEVWGRMNKICLRRKGLIAATPLLFMKSIRDVYSLVSHAIDTRSRLQNSMNPE